MRHGSLKAAEHLCQGTTSCPLTAVNNAFFINFLNAHLKNYTHENIAKYTSLDKLTCIRTQAWITRIFKHYMTFIPPPPPGKFGKASSTIVGGSYHIALKRAIRDSNSPASAGRGSQCYCISCVYSDGSSVGKYHQFLADKIIHANCNIIRADWQPKIYDIQLQLKIDCCRQLLIYLMSLAW